MAAAFLRDRARQRPRRRSIRPIAPTNSSSTSPTSARSCWSSRQGRTRPRIGVAQKLGVPIARLVAASGERRGELHARVPGVDGRRSGAAARARRRPTTSRSCCTRRAPRRARRSCRSRTATSARRRRTSGRRSRSPAADRGLVIMPLFHIHGLIAALLAPLSAGGEVCCTPGFNALKFFAWLGEVKPDVVHRRADHAPGDPAARAEERGDRRAPSGCASFARRRRRCRRR